jgi:hypothetical protein
MPKKYIFINFLRKAKHVVNNVLIIIDLEHVSCLKAEKSSVNVK